jgi:hypothetical protein
MTRGMQVTGLSPERSRGEGSISLRGDERQMERALMREGRGHKRVRRHMKPLVGEVVKRTERERERESDKGMRVTKIERHGEKNP